MAGKHKRRVTLRKCREWALQLLCQLDANPSEDLDTTIDDFWRQQWQIEEELKQDQAADPKPVGDDPPDVLELVAPEFFRKFVETRVRGVLAERGKLDEQLSRYCDNWEPYRLGTVERNVLRMGVWEMMNCPDVPPPVAINEAVDIAKYYSTTAAGFFVNGILDAFFKGRQVADKPVEDAKKKKR